MVKNKILFKGSFSADQVSLEETVSSRLIDTTLEEQCKNEWQRKLDEAAATGKQVWDSIVYRYESLEEHVGKLLLKVSTIPFALRVAMNSYTAELDGLGFAYAARGMYTSCFVLTSDTTYVFLEDAGKYLDRRKYMFVGGTLSKTEKELRTGADLFKQTKLECMQETGCLAGDINSLRLSAGYITSSYSICLLFTVQLNITFETLLERFKTANDGEAKGLIGIAAKDIQDFALTLHEKEHMKFVVLGLLNR